MKNSSEPLKADMLNSDAALDDKYSIQPASKDDIDELLILSRKVTNFNSRQFLDDEMVDSFLASPYFTEEITDNIENMTLVKEGSKILGLATWIDNELLSLMIDPDYQGVGLGRFLLKRTMDKKLENFDMLILECFTDNTRANLFYVKMGWVLMGTKEDCESGSNRNVYTFES